MPTLLATTMTAAIALTAATAASAITISGGNEIKSETTMLGGPGPVMASFDVTAGDDLTLDFSFSYAGPDATLDQFTFGLSDSEASAAPAMNFARVDVSGDVAAGGGIIGGVDLDDGETLFVSFSDNGSLGTGEEASVGFAVTGELRDQTLPDVAPIPLPASGLLLVGALGGIGLMRRKA